MKQSQLLIIDYTLLHHLDFNKELEQSKEELKLQDGEKHIRHIWVYFILILSGKFTVKQDDKGEVS